MAYDYKKEKPGILTDRGQKEFLQVRDLAHKLLKEAGAFKIFNSLKGITGDTWLQMAYIDRLVELGEIREITGPDVMGQDRVFVKA